MSTLAFVDSDMIAAAAVSRSGPTMRGVAASNAGRCNDVIAISSADTT
jgi:hypothetical protein